LAVRLTVGAEQVLRKSTSKALILAVGQARKQWKKEPVSSYCRKRGDVFGRGLIHEKKKIEHSLNTTREREGSSSFLGGGGVLFGEQKQARIREEWLQRKRERKKKNPKKKKKKKHTKKKTKQKKKKKKKKKTNSTPASLRDRLGGT